MSKADTALLIVDMINNFEFDMGETLAKKTEKIVPHILSLKEHARQNEWPIIYINDHYGLWQADIKNIQQECTNERSSVYTSHQPLNETSNQMLIWSPEEIKSAKISSRRPEKRHPT